MKTFLKFADQLHEGYTFIPKSIDDIKASPLSNKDAVVKAYNLVKAAGVTMEDPFAIDIQKPTVIKIHRSLENDIDTKDLKAKTGITFNFGNGSRGNLGAGNQGNAFEKYLSNDLGTFVASRNPKSPEYKYPDFIEDFAPKLLSNAKEIEIVDEGGLNKKRPLLFKGGKLSIESEEVKDIGATVTDITVKADGKPHYLSLKLGSTVTFFNIGISKILTKKDLEDGHVDNAAGIALLDLFAIDHDRYIETFGKYDPKAPKSKSGVELVDVTSKVDKAHLTHFLSTGIGYGYFLVHAKNAKPNSEIHTIYMDKATAAKAVKPISVKVKYPTVGSAKRIDIFIETELFTFKVNIRNKQGGVAPSHIMCDYSTKHDEI